MKLADRHKLALQLYRVIQRTVKQTASLILPINLLAKAKKKRLCVSGFPAAPTSNAPTLIKVLINIWSKFLNLRLNFHYFPFSLSHLPITHVQPPSIAEKFRENSLNSREGVHF